MEDYTYNLVPGKEGILQAHMLEVCPTIADGPISIKCQPLSMGDREDPARLVFTSKTGPAIATSLIDLGDRFSFIINDVECKKVEKPMPKLPVATAFWTPQPNLQTGARAGFLQAALTILHSATTLLQSRWATGLQLWESKPYILIKIQQFASLRTNCSGTVLHTANKERRLLP